MKMPDRKKIAFPIEPISVPIFLKTGTDLNIATPAIVRDATNNEAKLWDKHWRPTFELHNRPQKEWRFSKHIRRSIPGLFCRLGMRKRRSLCLAVECKSSIEAMISLTYDEDGSNSPTKRPQVYVEYIGNSPENEGAIIKATGQPRRSQGAAKNLIAMALMLSDKVGLGGWIGLDSKLDAAHVYEKNYKMIRGPRRKLDDGEFDYFEAGPDQLCYLLDALHNQQLSLGV